LIDKRFKEGQSNTGRVGTRSNPDFKAAVVELFVGTPTGLVVGATLGAATVGTEGVLEADCALGALGADGAMGPWGHGCSSTRWRRNWWRRGRGSYLELVGDCPRSIIRRQNFLPLLVLQKRASYVW
jgi:hypothetical protein